MIFEHKCEVLMKNIGKGNVMTNKAFLSFMEEVGGLHSSSVKYGIEEIEENGVGWVLADWKLQIISRPKYREQVTVKTWARETKKFSTYRDFEMYDEQGKLCAIASSKWILVDIYKNKIARLEDEVIARYNPETKRVFEEIEFEKIRDLNDYDSETEYTARRLDIDINKHVHNLNYLDLAYEALPDDVYDECEKNNVRITYKKEIKLGDTVKCLYKHYEDKDVVTIKSLDDSVIHSIIELY